MNLMPFKIPPGPPLGKWGALESPIGKGGALESPIGKGGAFESPPLPKGDLGGFLSNRPLKSTALPLIPSPGERGLRGGGYNSKKIDFLQNHQKLY
jgi:hypothetical protein